MVAAVGDTSVDLYAAAFRARCDAYRRPGRPEVDEPGVHGLLPGAEDSLARLLITDDRAYEVLEALLPPVKAAIITAFASATRCVDLIAAHLAGRVTTPTAMVCRDLRTVPVVPLPGDLALRPVLREPGDPPDGVPLREAAAIAMRADPDIRGELDAFADYLRSLPSAFRLLAAVDPSGAVRATAGSGAFGIYGSVIFVDTDPRWRGRGVGTAMTSTALHAAREAGATRACLDASDAGAGIYRRLGFEAVGPVTRFYRPA
jgi:GNAT superfamily N-acetyltransferase